MRVELNGSSSGTFGGSAGLTMSDAQARRTLLGAFERASEADRSYLVRVAMTLGDADDEAAVPRNIVVGTPQPQSTHLRLVRAV